MLNKLNNGDATDYTVRLKRKCTIKVDTGNKLSSKSALTSSHDKVHQSHQWNHLPHAVLARVFWYLNPVDLRNASATCKPWRDCYFYPTLWRDVQLCKNERRDKSWLGAGVVIDQCGKYARSVKIFPFTGCTLKKFLDGGWTKLVGKINKLSFISHIKANGQVSAMIPDLLEKLLGKCKNLEMLQLKSPENPIVQDLYEPFDGDAIISDRSLADRIWEKIKSLLEISPSMQQLKLGYRVDVVGRQGRLEDVARLCGKTLTTLHCPLFHASDIHLESPPDVEAFKELTQLNDLRCNLLYVTDDLLRILASPNHCPMKSLVILVTYPEDRDNTLVAGMSNKAWEELVSHSPQLQVGVSYFLHDRTGGTVNLQNLLQKSAIPLHQLKVVFTQTPPDTVFELIQTNYSHVLHRLELMYFNESFDDVPLVGIEQEVNPVVMMMWRCRSIKELIITGFDVASDDIVGISRLCGSNLEVLGIQGSCIQYEEPVDTEDILKKEVSKCLGKDWQPMDEIQAELALWEIMDRHLFPDNEYGSGPVS